MTEATLRVTTISRRVAPAHGPGGLETAVREQVHEVARSGIHTDLWTETPREAGRVAAAERDFDGVASLHWVERGALPLGARRGTVVLDRITNYPAWARRVARTIQDPGDVVHAHGLAGLGAAEQRAAGRWQVPFVLTAHGMEEFLGSGLKHALYAPFRAGMRRTGAAADCVVVTDRVLVPVVTRSLGIPEGRTRVIPNAIDPDAGPAAADVERARSVLAAAGGSDTTYVSLGRLEANKGFELLAQAFGQAARDLGEWRWVLIGDGPQRRVIEAAVARAGIADRVVLAGRVDDPTKHGVLAAADWFVHPTRFEGSSLVTLEAMAHGLPVLGTRAGGLPDKIEDGSSGLLVEPGSAEALAAGLRAAARAPASDYGAVGRRIVERDFSWASVGRAFADLYRELHDTPLR